MDTYLDKTDVEKLDAVLRNTTLNSNYFNDTCDKIIKSQTDGLDNLMRDIYVECVQDDNPSMKTLQTYYLELTILN